ncbi:MAG: hypothetical protein ABJC10_04755 [Acidobacteriota bacterium]
MQDKTPTLVVALILLTAISLASCSSGRSDSGSPSGPTGAQSSAAPSPKSGFDADLEYVRKGQYTYIWVFSRKDSKPLDKEDGAFLRTNAPQVVDWVTTDEGRKVIAGTNFNLELSSLGLLKKRFNVEDYSGK